MLRHLTDEEKVFLQEKLEVLKTFKKHYGNVRWL